MAFLTTPQAGLRYPPLTETADANVTIGNLATDLDSVVIPRFGTTTIRDSAIPSPVVGQTCYVTNSSAGPLNRCLNIYTASGWRANYQAPLFAYKPATETVTSSTTFQNDDHLSLSLETNTIYQLSGMLQYFAADNDTTPDLKFQLIYPSQTSVSVGAHGAAYNTTNVTESASFNGMGNSGFDATSPAGPFVFGAMGAAGSVIFSGIVAVGPTSGTLQLQWAQNTSDPSGVTIQDGSFMMLTRVG